MATKDGALGLMDDFYEQELEQVVLAQGLTTLDEYRTARRTGRGVVLSRSKRDTVWPVFEEYRGQLASRKLKEVDDAYREVAAFMTKDQEDGKKMPAYSAVVVDETQDLGPQALKLLRAIMPAGNNDLFLVGDERLTFTMPSPSVLEWTAVQCSWYTLDPKIHTGPNPCVEAQQKHILLEVV